MSNAICAEALGNAPEVSWTTGSTNIVSSAAVNRPPITVATCGV